MKKTVIGLLLVPGFLIFSLSFLSFRTRTQEASKTPASLPDEVKKIVSVSCVPCHTSDGGLMSRSKFNMNEWTNYSPEKQKAKAAKIYAEVNKGAMPPKSAREKNPELIPTSEQIAILKGWSESFPADAK
jgi:mono/diheme cytochrome c family protein